MGGAKKAIFPPILFALKLLKDGITRLPEAKYEAKQTQGVLNKDCELCSF